MKTFEVTLPDGSTRQVKAVYYQEFEGALIFYDVSESEDGPIHYLAGGHEKAAPRVMQNEFPKGFWTAVREG